MLIKKKKKKRNGIWLKIRLKINNDTLLFIFNLVFSIVSSFFVVVIFFFSIIDSIVDSFYNAQLCWCHY